MNILFLGGAKRVSMARKFKAAGNARGLDCKIFGYELCKEVPLAIEGDIIVGRRWRDADVVSHIIDVCREHNISIVVPFVDAAVAVAARVTQATNGAIFSPTGNVEQIEAMFDKVAANRVFTKAGISVPAEYTDGPVSSPLIAKPRHGSASKGLVMIDNDEQLNAISANRADYLIQERIDHRREYTADCYVSTIDGRVLACVVRRRDEVAGGEVVRTTVIRNHDAEQLVLSTLHATGLRGAVTVQLIEDVDTGRLMVMEVNPRLGGGAVAAVCAGADLPTYIIDESLGIAGKPTQNYRQIVVTRYLEETFFDVDEQ